MGSPQGSRARVTAARRLRHRPAARRGARPYTVQYDVVLATCLGLTRLSLLVYAGTRCTVQAALCADHALRPKSLSCGEGCGCTPVSVEEGVAMSGTAN
jgi:hypothetical protein